jgi:hypothetical protein
MMAIGGRVTDLFKQQTLNQPKLAHLDKMLYMWFTAMHSEGQPMIGSLITEKSKPFYDEIQITDKCTFSKNWMQNYTRTSSWGRYPHGIFTPLISCAAQVQKH